MDEYFLSETYSPISSTVASWSELLVYVEFCNFMSSVREIFLCWSQINWGLLKAGKRASKIANIAVKPAHRIFRHACWGWNLGWECNACCKGSYPSANVAVKPANRIFHHAWWGWNPGWECNACCKVIYPSHCFLPPQSIEFLTHMDIPG